MTTSRIFLPFENGTLSRDDSPVCYWNAMADPALRDFGPVDAIQTFAPDAQALATYEARLIDAADSTYPTTLLALTKHRGLNRYNFAEVWTHTSAGGTIVVSGDKTQGVDAFIKEIKGFVPDVAVTAKSHGKVFWLTRPDDTPAPVPEWLALGTLAPNKDVFLTAPGMFSQDHIDPGSALLVDALPQDIKGTVADFGSGWGYLAHTVLAAHETIIQLDLFEADKPALDAARANVTDPRARFHWVDVGALDATRQFDLVVSNPPFHETQRADPSIGQAFIEAAARTLKPKGRFIMVANRHLPYEATLTARFRTVDKIAETAHYKVISARAPLKLK